MKKAENTLTKDLEAWTGPVDGLYSCTIDTDAGWDASYNFFDPSTSKTIGVESVQVTGGQLIIKKSDDSLIRMIIIK